ncbi:hypothetical protein GCM10028806_52020 [Spirosoma terrae]|uniref:PKD domain-containing protein n=1 Tax=Spirosoma terrae TaxID=1968276 RepID=A0A6L9LDJ1_9BACT|nr:PKD domain-containing protein [Spirosoma terrae]NDU96558.1 PKD domain-containing protein [Spirosoma terrae]
MKTQLVRSYLSVYLSILSLLFITGSCDQKEPTPKPVAFFGYSPTTNLVAPVTISFANKSNNSTSYVWTYGTGQTATSNDLTLTFSAGGVYTITLAAKGEGGTDTYSQTIYIDSPPVAKPPTAGFTYSPSQNLVAPAIVSFSNTSSNASGYKWDFGDGTTSTQTNPTKQFTKDGSYTVKLVATGAGGSAETSKNLVIGKAATTGQAVFWTSQSTGWNSIDVTVDGTAAGTITGYYNSAPNCGASVTVTRPPGTYAYTARSNTGVTWSGNITITENQCSTMRLNFPDTPATNTNCDWNKYTNSESLTVESKWGGCGADGLSIKITNKTNVKLNCYFCMEYKNGKWDCGASTINAGAYHTSWSCENTGKVKVWAIDNDVFNKNNCPYPKP